MIYRNSLGMVHFQAKKQQWAHQKNHPQTAINYDYEDLVQVGSIGLLKAIDKYDVTNKKGASFNTFAFWWVRSEIFKFINWDNALIHVPLKKREKHSVITINVDMNDPITQRQLMGADSQLKEEFSALDRILFEELLNNCFDGKSIEYDCFARYFGVDGREKSKMPEIAEDLGITRAKVRKHIENCKFKFWAYLKNNKIDVSEVKNI